MNQEKYILDSSLGPTFNPLKSPILVAIFNKKILAVAQCFDFRCKCAGKCNVNLLGDVILHMGLWGVCFIDENGYVFSPEEAKNQKTTLYKIRSPVPVLSLSQLEELIEQQEILRKNISRKLDNSGFSGIISLSGGSSFLEKQKLINKLKDKQTAILEQDFKVCEYNTLSYEHYFDALRENGNRIAQSFGIPGGLLGRNFTHSNYEAALSDLESVGRTMAYWLDKSLMRTPISRCFQLKKQEQAPQEQPAEIQSEEPKNEIGN
jgi:hypothetical protein